MKAAQEVFPSRSAPPFRGWKTIVLVHPVEWTAISAVSLSVCLIEAAFSRYHGVCGICDTYGAYAERISYA